MKAKLHTKVKEIMSAESLITMKNVHDDLFATHHLKQRDKVVITKPEYEPYWKALRKAIDKGYVIEAPTTLDWMHDLKNEDK